jgi:hypothetical protein
MPGLASRQSIRPGAFSSDAAFQDSLGRSPRKGNKIAASAESATQQCNESMLLVSATILGKICLGLVQPLKTHLQCVSFGDKSLGLRLASP